MAADKVLLVLVGKFSLLSVCSGNVDFSWTIDHVTFVFDFRFERLFRFDDKEASSKRRLLVLTRFNDLLHFGLDLAVAPVAMAAFVGSPFSWLSSESDNKGVLGRGGIVIVVPPPFGVAKEIFIAGVDFRVEFVFACRFFAYNSTSRASNSESVLGFFCWVVELGLDWAPLTGNCTEVGIVDFKEVSFFTGFEL